MNTKSLTRGILGGLAGGLVFGVMMGMMGMLPMIAGMVGSDSAAVGFIIHMFNSVVIGAGFALVLGSFAGNLGSSIGLGTFYGMTWWLLGPLTLMPLLMGMGFGVNWNLTAATNMLPSLMGHAIYGLVLGVGYGLLNRRALACDTAGVPGLSSAEGN